MNDECLANSNKDSDFFIIKNNPELIDRKAIEDIKTDITQKYISGDGTIGKMRVWELDELIRLIDKHYGGNNE